MANLSARMSNIQSPVIRIIGDLVRKNQGTISLGQGVVYYGPPDCKEQIRSFWNNRNNHWYQSESGISELIGEIRNKLLADNDIHVSENQRIMVTAGSNMAFSHIIHTICDPGDEIILISPFYFNHEMAVEAAGCRVIQVDSNDQYLPELPQLENAISPRTRAIVTISPNNPTGAVYSKKLLEEINALCNGKGIYHISDEAYEYFLYDGATHFSPGSIPESHGHTISLFSLSKSYGMASWRIGYALFPKKLYDGMSKIQDTVLICPAVVSQFAAIAALREGSSYCLDKRKTIELSRQILKDGLTSIEDHCIYPESTQGAFYILIRLHTDMNDLDIATKLIRDYKVATIPGSTFGLTSGCYLRIAYGALSPEIAEEGINRLVTGIRGII